MKKNEKVLVIPTKVVNEVGEFQGFSPEAQKYIDVIQNSEELQYVDRDKAEQDPSFKQIIPYCLIRFEDQFFIYQRGKGVGESRLAGDLSFGIGGHINPIDEDDLDNSILAGMKREINEEVSIEGDYTVELVGLINDDSNEVGKVHLGLVYVIDVESPNVFCKEEELSTLGFKTIKYLSYIQPLFESWSQICFDNVCNVTKVIN